MQRKIIITADDYGMTDSVNNAIEACLEVGHTHATCVMTNMPAFLNACSLRSRFPHASIGIHWTITQGSPASPATMIPSLVNKNGKFYPKREFQHRWLSKRINKEEVSVELTAQFNLFKEVVGTPDFWNTHQDVHLLPGLFKYCVNLGLDLGVYAMRCHRRFVVARNHAGNAYNRSHPLFWLKGKIIALWSRQAEAKGMCMPDGKVYSYGYYMNQFDFGKTLQRLNWETIRKVVEFTIHPATVIEKDYFGLLKESRINDFKIFSNPELEVEFTKYGIQSVGFEVLHHGS